MVSTGQQERTTLTEEQLLAYGPNRGLRRPGPKQRYFCPVHKSDKQASLEVNVESGHFSCYACGCWGYLEHKYQEWLKAQAEKKAGEPAAPKPLLTALQPRQPATSETPLKIAPESMDDRRDIALEAALNFPGSPAEKYVVEVRGISSATAAKYGLGFIQSRQWTGRRSHFDRVTVGHTAPAGEVPNIYGRAIPGSDGEVPPKNLVHDHLSGPKVIFNGAALSSTKPLFIAEGLFDALSLIEAGYSNAVAIFGVGNLRWSWVKAKTVVVAFDFDLGGRGGMRRYIDEAVRWGKEVLVIDKRVFDGHKDLNELWVAKGRIDLDADRPIEAQQTSPVVISPAVVEPNRCAPQMNAEPDRSEVAFDYHKVPTKPRRAVSLIKVWNNDDDTV